MRSMQEQARHYAIRDNYLLLSGAADTADTANAADTAEGDIVITPRECREICTWTYQIIDSCSVNCLAAVATVSYLE